jgi:hypothetical protein
MVKFKFLINTPYESHYNTHYARSQKSAVSVIAQWNAQFKDTGYSVELVEFIETTEKKPPTGYSLW